MQETINNVIALGIILLLGTRGRDWDFYETDLEWWEVRLWTRRN